MSDFWTRKKLESAVSAPVAGPTNQEFVDSIVQTMEEGASPLPEPEEADFDIQEVLNNANLRLEQGRLYQMIMSSNIFGETDADPQAIKNVQREIVKFAKERMEIMLGMRQEAAKEQPVIVSSPFNDLEVLTLKTIAAQMSKGATTKAAAPTVAPKKDGITSISGVTKKQTTVSVEPKPLPKNRTAPVAPKPATAAPAQAPQSAIVEDDKSYLTKPIDKMTPDELLAYEQDSQNRHQNLKAALPANRVPIPSPAELEAMYTTRISNMTAAPGTTAMQLVNLLSQR